MHVYACVWTINLIRSRLRINVYLELYRTVINFGKNCLRKYRHVICCYIQIFENSVKDMRKNGEDVEGRLDLTDICTEANSCESYAPFRSRKPWINIPKGYNTCSDGQWTSVFWIKEPNLFDSGLDLVRSQILKGTEYEWIKINRRKDIHLEYIYIKT